MIASARKIQALQNLAERPGTEAEGRVARAMLEKLTGRAYIPPRPAPAPPKRKPRVPREKAVPKVPEYFADKLKLAMKVRERFPLGATVYYNAFGHDPNHMGTVTGYEPSGFRVVVWFADFGKSALVYACSDRGWHLTLKPMPKSMGDKMRTHGAKYQ